MWEKPSAPSRPPPARTGLRSMSAHRPPGARSSAFPVPRHACHFNFPARATQRRGTGEALNHKLFCMVQEKTHQCH